MQQQQHVLQREVAAAAASSCPRNAPLPRGPGVGRRQVIQARHRARPSHLLARTHQRSLPYQAVPSAADAATSSTIAGSLDCPAVKAVLFDMDGVLCNSEEVSREAACEVMKELYGLDVHPDEFLPFTGTGEANFLGGVARKYGAPFEVESCKAKFFEIYMAKYALPGSGIGHVGARQLVEACRAAGLSTAVASSADLVKVHASLRAADIPLDLFDTIVSADAFERLKPAPDIFLAAAAQLGVAPTNCVVIEDAVAGVQAARSAGMRVLGVTTTLSEVGMTAAAPDRILPHISKISVEDLTSLPYTVQQQGQQQGKEQEQQQQGGEQAESGTGASNGCSSSGAASQGWLEGTVNLPGGYRTTRRDVLKLGSLTMGLSSLYVAVSRGQSMKYVSPRALINALLPGASPAAMAKGVDEGGRVAAFKRYIADMEKRGGGQQVPEFPAGLDWLNAPPLKLSRELRGKVVVLDFWTYCCINCMHVLPDLAFIESKYQDRPVTVVGVHSAKFENEKDSEAIRNAVLRYEISHPVVNDGNMVLWRGLGVSSWPTLAIVSPQGKLIGMLAGEGHREDVDDILAAALEYYGEQGLLDDTPVPQALERDKDPRLAASPLRFPGKVTADLPGNRLFISDSNNNRVVITDLQGNFKDQVGGNGPGLQDGSFETACFNRPQGLAYSAARNVLYVADTEAHALREIDLKSRTVKTLAGNGVKGSSYFGGKVGTAQVLNSPWDVVIDPSGTCLYFAMAGQHQIWRYDLATGVTEVFSGNGFERNQNGKADVVSWAQPSGLTLSPDGKAMFVADSESSAVRRLSLEDRSAAACVGGDNMFADNLFRFGDKDGSGTDALLQHPLAVLATESGKVFVADSYNHRLKVLDPATNTITTVAGSGSAAFGDGKGTKAQLSEPGGLCLGPNGTILVADTNNSLIRRFDPASGQLSTLALKDVPPPRVSPDAAVARPIGASIPEGATLVRSPDALAADAAELRLTLALPPGYHLTKGANSRFETVVIGGEAAAAAVEMSPAKGALKDNGASASAVLKMRRRPGAGAVAEGAAVRALAKIYFCQDDDVCLFEEVVFEVPLAAAGSGSSGQAQQVLELSHTVSAAAPKISLPGL